MEKLEHQKKKLKQHTRNPRNVFFEARGGQFIVLTHPKDEIMEETETWKYGIDDPVKLLRSVASLERRHGAVPSRYEKFELALQKMGNNIRKLQANKKREFTTKMRTKLAGQFATQLATNILELDQFSQ